jgi:hypothetical protein
MAKRDYWLGLFRANVANLNAICPGVGERIACPICLQELTETDIDDGTRQMAISGRWKCAKKKRQGKRPGDPAVPGMQQCGGDAGRYPDQLLQVIKERADKGASHGLRTAEIVEIDQFHIHNTSIHITYTKIAPGPLPMVRQIYNDHGSTWFHPLRRIPANPHRACSACDPVAGCCPGIANPPQGIRS